MSLDIYLCADVGHPEGPRPLEGLDFNITHNVSKMWREAGCYSALYESGGMRAEEHVADLEAAIQRMESRPESYKKLEPGNGWGTYDGALRWLREVHRAFRDHPRAVIAVSR